MHALFLKGVLLGFAAAISPGPLQALFLAQTMETGWRRTIPAAMAPLLSDGPIILIVIFLLTQVPEEMVKFLRISGGLFLVYLALITLNDLRRQDDLESPSVSPVSRGLLKAALTNLLNPNPYIFWATVSAPILLDALAESPLHVFTFLLGFYLLLVGGFMVIITVFASGRRLAPQYIPGFQALAGFALGSIGIYQLYSGISG